MKNRPFWENAVEKAWKEKSIIWLSGVRRAGKTVLCQYLKNTIFFDCELPSVRRQMEDPEFFLTSHQGKRIVLDEIHRLQNPSELLKIAADHFPEIKIIATGSSTLGASQKFSDTLTGRKIEIWLTPMLSFESQIFENTSLTHRMQNGGLPPYFLEHEFPEKALADWLDSYWAKDIQELFRLEKKYAFQKCAELIFAQSGGILKIDNIAAAAGVSRTSINNFISVLETTYVAHIIRPFSTRLSSEIIAAPKIYGFDTGMICFAKGWTALRPEDMELLWEHLVLNEMHGQLQTRDIYYWRDKQDHEIDFVYFKNRDKKNPIVIECKWNSDKFDPAHLMIFRKKYPSGENYVVCPNVQENFQKKYGDIIVNFVGLVGLIHSLF